MARLPDQRPSRLAAPALLLAACCAVGGLLLIATWAAGARPDLSRPKLGPAPGPLLRPRSLPAPVVGAEADFARAFAWAGRPQAEAGLVAVPAELRPWLPAARQLLAVQPLRRSVAVVGGSASSPGADASPALARRSGPDQSPMTVGRAPAGDRPGAGVGRPPAAGVVVDHGTRLAVAEPGIYLDRRLDPSDLAEDGFGLDLPPEAAYAVRLDTADAGGLRLDGGLVVPGRWYRVGDGCRIRIGAPTQLHLRPLGAVGSYHPHPVAIPRPAGDS